MEFEYDRAKSRANLRKHGIDFEQAQALWQDELGLQVPARTAGEARFALIARRAGTFWTAIYTLRGERIRIISVRRARSNEQAAYDHH